ncbi:TIGR02466 family protein [Sphingomonas sp. BGYR3]|uniref:TIGR02466 family protein n=1 Tax=Sphingomonas sp. BGYR3 TaxID=2975483 RepID=UPI0021A72789|nr:TIGR02466 family protein [Sphingomonas sp. BGYR3]MDG5487963.1 TIGR02466 family protein [Sphingomonas sp. BGYR3]
MPSRSLFATRFYEGTLADAALLADLEDSALTLAAEDRAGQRWSRDHGYRGYTSYASLNDLPLRDPAIADLVRHLNRHVAAFAADCAFDLGGKRLRLDSLWVNVMKPGATHSGHIHPHSVVSGTVYIAVPPGAGALKLEDPRLGLMMAAPTRTADAEEALQPFVYAQPRAGTVFLWESWLRHEVMPHAGKGERISISFNYRR